MSAVYAIGLRTCSGRGPIPMKRAGSWRKTGKFFKRQGDERQGGFARRFTTSDDVAMDESFHMLNQRSRPFSTPLDFVKIDDRHRPQS